MDNKILNFQEHSFDICLAYGALQHVDLDKALSQLSRILTPDLEMISAETLRKKYFIDFL